MKSILVIGCGSIGRRHIRNLLQLGANGLRVYDESKEQMETAVAEYGVSPVDAVDADRFDLVLVCTPPNSHVDVARKAIRGGAHVFIEKPIAHEMDGVSRLLSEAKERKRFIAVGYNLRFHRGVRLLKEAIERGDIGTPLMLRAEVGQYLPDWRPGTDYRAGYNASAAMGGGIVLDASHEIDYVRWLVGDVASISCAAEHLSSLAIDVEDAAAIIMRMRSGAIAEVHLDSIQRAYSRTCKVIGEEGTLVWEYGGDVRRFSAASGRWESTAANADPNEMYIDEMKHLLMCLEGEAVPIVDGEDGRRVLEIALAAKESSRNRCEIAL
jgi:predicted dehydrogenase